MKYDHVALRLERAAADYPVSLAATSTAILVALWAVAKHVIDRRYPI